MQIQIATRPQAHALILLLLYITSILPLLRALVSDLAPYPTPPPPHPTPPHPAPPLSTGEKWLVLLPEKWNKPLQYGWRFDPCELATSAAAAGTSGKPTPRRPHFETSEEEDEFLDWPTELPECAADADACMDEAE